MLVSFGTIHGHLPGEVLEKFYIAFSKVSNKLIIWKSIQKHKHVPNNVHLFQCLPQNDLLAHPKVILFITHCGINGLTEAVYHGVPMLGIPLIFDQWNNAKAIESKGYGKYLDINIFTANDLQESILEVLTGQAQTNVRRASQLLRDLPPASETVAFWVEHVIKHGSKHLKPNIYMYNLSISQFYLIDMFMCVILRLVCVLFMFRFVLLITGKI